MNQKQYNRLTAAVKGKLILKRMRDGSRFFHSILTWIAVKAATIAGDPKPCDINEKWVKCRCIDGSNICGGLVLHKGVRSWLSRSISSFVTYSIKRQCNSEIQLIFVVFFLLIFTCFVFSRSSFLLYDSCGSVCCRNKYSATCRDGNSVSQIYPKSLAKWIASPMSKLVSLWCG